MLLTNTLPNCSFVEQRLVVGCRLDVVSALAVCVHMLATNLVVLCLQAQYVQLLLQLRSQQQLRIQKAGLSLLGPQGLQFYAEGGNNRRAAQLQRACANLEMDLNMTRAVPLPPTSCGASSSSAGGCSLLTLGCWRVAYKHSADPCRHFLRSRPAYHPPTRHPLQPDREALEEACGVACTLRW